MSDNNKTLEQEFEEETENSIGNDLGGYLGWPCEYYHRRIDWLEEKVNEARESSALMAYERDAVKKENAEQSKRIAELEKVLEGTTTEWRKQKDELVAEREKNKRMEERHVLDVDVMKMQIISSLIAVCNRLEQRIIELEEDHGKD